VSSDRSLERIGLTAHKASLSCLFLLYRRPDEFVDELSRLSSAQKIRTALVLSLHALPYVVVLAVPWPSSAPVGLWCLRTRSVVR